MFDRPSLSRSAALAAGVCLIDQLTKAWALDFLREGVSVPFLPFMSLTLTHNTGAAFGSLKGWPDFLLGVTGLLLVGMGGLLFRWRRSLTKAHAAFWALSAVIGGAAGNLADRLRFGAVTDFLDLGFWPVFNAADMAISVGSVVFAFSLWRQGEK